MMIRLAVCASSVLIFGLTFAADARAQAPAPERDSTVSLLGKRKAGETRLLGRPADSEATGTTAPANAEASPPAKTADNKSASAAKPAKRQGRILGIPSDREGRPLPGTPGDREAPPADKSVATDGPLLGKPGDAPLPGKAADAPLLGKPTDAPLLGKPADEASFRKSQLENQRVLAASVETKFELKAEFRRRGIPYPAADIYLRAFKREHELEVWVRPLPGDPFVLLKTYAICSISGTAGPKSAEGDEQTPEGFYRIDSFNPWSGYHLSLHINYPNEADVLRLGRRTSLGGDIFIHGGCKTIGCLPITDEAIKELYWLSVEARTRGQDIPVHIFPSRLNKSSLDQYARVFQHQPQLLAFWRDLKRGYDYFEEMRQLPRVVVDPVGRYRVDAAPDKVTRALNAGAGAAAAAVL